MFSKRFLYILTSTVTEFTQLFVLPRNIYNVADMFIIVTV